MHGEAGSKPVPQAATSDIRTLSVASPADVVRAALTAKAANDRG